mgnify:CR=1 FL=1
MTVDPNAQGIDIGIPETDRAAIVEGLNRLLAAGPADLELEVSDDGRGIAPDVVAGVGLRSLRERAEELGGRYEVVCPPAGGTTVRAWLTVGGYG